MGKHCPAMETLIKYRSSSTSNLAFKWLNATG